jgi:hypothetical protein
MKLRKFIATTIREYLNEQQEVKTNLNDNFKKWFGSSKIIENGKPMICYHGSENKNIHVFDISKIGYNKGNYGHYGYGIYFSTDIREAKTYGSEIYKCYIKISNPFIGNDKQILELKHNGIDNIDDLSIISIDYNSFKKSFQSDNLIYNFITNIEKNGLEYAWDEIHKQDKSNIDFDLLNDISNMLEYTTLNKNVDGVPYYIIDELNKLNKKVKLNKGFAYEQSLHWITDLGNRSKEVTDVIKKLGYDGVFYGSEIVVFEPNQIKSVENDGTWDIGDGNIFS